ncbi:hypothetical protein BN903_24 [Halorubrum sp. AJ67]|nr:hypothetical protein BN903_24 [Halorubrum sp. AJ67]
MTARTRRRPPRPHECRADTRAIGTTRETREFVLNSARPELEYVCDGVQRGREHLTDGRSRR